MTAAPGAAAAGFGGAGFEGARRIRVSGFCLSALISFPRKESYITILAGVKFDALGPAEACLTGPL
jgi:hypothetical protein